MPESRSFAAVDLGATSGRVIVGDVSPQAVRFAEVSRFANRPTSLAGTLTWDIVGLYDRMLDGLRDALAADSAIHGVGIVSWALDYGLIRSGRLRSQPRHYRDGVNAVAMAALHDRRIGERALFDRNGIQRIPISSIYQLVADRDAGFLDGVDAMLMIPDLMGFFLTSAVVAERTNASTSGLLDARTGVWDDGLLGRVGLPRHILPELVDAGTTLAGLRPEVAQRIGGSPIVTTVASHDTASAVVAAPAADEDFVYISCGTWALVGTETSAPIMSDEAFEANFTNERGLDGTNRFLKNVTGLWILSETIRQWEQDGDAVDLTALIAAATACRPAKDLIDPDDPVFAAPGAMATRVLTWLRDRGCPVPQSRAETVRLIIDSLADSLAAAVGVAARISGVRAAAVHVVGGGAQNLLLCQAIADRTGLRVVAGPVEATAIGNLLVQARTAGRWSMSLQGLRAVVRASSDLRIHEPTVRS